MFGLFGCGWLFGGSDVFCFLVIWIGVGGVLCLGVSLLLVCCLFYVLCCLVFVLLIGFGGVLSFCCLVFRWLCLLSIVEMGRGVCVFWLVCKC